MLTLWKDVQEGIKNYATQHGIDLVLGYGEPLAKEMLTQYPNLNRKMQAMDHGSAVPLFVAPGADISKAVLESLNRPVRGKIDNAKGKAIDLD